MFKVTLCLTGNPGHVFIYDSGKIQASNTGASITVEWGTGRKGGSGSKSKTIGAFIKEGIVIEYDTLSNYLITISSDVDIMPGCSCSEMVYRVEGSLPYLGNRLGEIDNFDKACSPLFNVSNLLAVGSDLLLHNRSVKKINYLFGDQREWRSGGDNSSGNQLIKIPSGLLSGMNNLKELNGYMCRMDNITHIPSDHFNDLINISNIYAFNDCKKLSNIFGGRLSSGFLRLVVMYNNLRINSFVPSNLISSGGKGSLICCILNNVDNASKSVSLGPIINAPEKRLCLLTTMKLDISTVNKLFNSKVVEFGGVSIGKVGSEDEVVDAWKTSMENNVMSTLLNPNEVGNYKKVYTIMLDQ